MSSLEESEPMFVHQHIEDRRAQKHNVDHFNQFSQKGIVTRKCHARERAWRDLL